MNQRNASSAALWASAFVIGALTIVAAGRLPGRAAHAEMVSGHSGYTLLTTDSGLGGDSNPNELLYVIDNRDQVILVYEVEDAHEGRIVLRAGGSLINMFRNARR